MKINIVLREKRKELGFTQEQIAEYLGVSTPAVNKWEKGTTYPDITLLSPLARLLQIDLNTLFCFNEDLSKEEIACFQMQVSEAIKKEGIEAGFRMSENKIKEFPNCARLLHWQALMMDGALLISELLPEQKEQYEEKVIAWYERAAEQSEDMDIRMGASYMLASKYMQRDEYENAQKLVDRLPEHNCLDKKVLQAEIWSKQDKTKEAEEILERKLLMMLNEVQGILMRMIKLALAEKNEQRAEEIGEICRKAVRLFGLWDYNQYVPLLDIALARRDTEQSLMLIDKLLGAAFTPWEMQESPLYYRMKYKPEKNSWNIILPPLLSALENSPEYEFMRSDSRFGALLEKYRGRLEKKGAL